jgi:sulfite reductase beta subunit-like hemoprotein
MPAATTMSDTSASWVSTRRGEEYYQVTLGGVKVYVEQRTTGEKFIDTYRRVGLEPFKEQVYGPASH